MMTHFPNAFRAVNARQADWIFVAALYGQEGREGKRRGAQEEERIKRRDGREQSKTRTRKKGWKPTG